MKSKRAERATEQTPQVTDDEQAVTRFAGWNLVFRGSWGSLAKPRSPQALRYRHAPRAKTKLPNKLNQSFLNLLGLPIPPLKDFQPNR
jgi:hypothetical protein